MESSIVAYIAPYLRLLSVISMVNFWPLNSLWCNSGVTFIVIVIDSVEENELQEVENKLGAINEAIELAEQLWKYY